MAKEFAFVLDREGKRLSPTPVNNAWYLLRKDKAKLVRKHPMMIQLHKVVATGEIDASTFHCGIDDGSKHVGIALVQKGKTKNKVVFKGQMEQRQDVTHLIDVRRGYRRYKRNHKRYRSARFDNRASSNRPGRIAPSIKQKRDAIIRVVRTVTKWCRIDTLTLEDVMIDMRVVMEGKKLYAWQYQKSNRLDENIRKATLLRDDFTCMECGAKNCRLEVHHIVPRKLKGADSIHNLITLCSTCHDKTKGVEERFMERYQKMIQGKNVRTDHAQHVMQGKTYLRQELGKLAVLYLTTGGDTANKRIDWNIEKSHSNDAIVMTGLKVEDVAVREWIMKPMRRKSKAKVDEVMGFRHRDLIQYMKKNGETYRGWITAIYPKKKQCNMTTVDGKVLKRYGLTRCRVVWRYNKIYWL